MINKHSQTFDFIYFWKSIFLVVTFSGFSNLAIGQVAINQVDDFNDGSVNGWITGKANDTIIINQNNKLQVRAIGGFGQFGKLLTFNESQWSGDYIGQGITSIKMKLQNTFNPLNVSLKMRLAIGNTRAPGPPGSPTGTWFVSTVPVVIDVASGEVEAIFSIEETALTKAQGPDSYASVLSNVAALRIINATSFFNPRGDDITIATLLIDDITACGCLETPYEESMDGDLSDNHGAPTVIQLKGSMDTITACQKGVPRDIDYFTIEIPQDSALHEIELTNYSAADINNRAFIGIQSGTVFSVDANNATAADLLGGLTYGTPNVGNDILASMGTLVGSQGFMPPLGNGKYTIWLNQTGDESCASLNFKMFEAPVNTDLSNDRFNPTNIEFSSLQDSISNCFGGNSNDVDYFTFIVPPDSALIGINLTSYTVADPNNQAFIGLQSGNTFTEPATGTNIANLLGGLLFGSANQGTNILPAMGTLVGSQGFNDSLTAGTYTIWLNQTGDESCASFQFIFSGMDLSSDRFNPTAISLNECMDTVSNCVQGSPTDVDYFTFNVPSNSILSELNLINYTAEGVNNKAFIGIQTGTTFTEPTTGTEVANLLGGLTYGATELGTNILPAMGTLGGSQGFIPPLTAGDYTIWLNQTGPISCATFELKLSPPTNCPSVVTITNEPVCSGIYQASDTIKTLEALVVESGNSVTFQGGKSVILTDGFHAIAGSSFLAQIANCPSMLNEPEIDHNIVSKSTINAILSKKSYGLRIYPNPFYQSTEIEYELTKKESVNLSLYTLSGNLIETIVDNEIQEIGRYAFDVGKEMLQEGMYLVVFQTDLSTITEKIILLK